MAKRFMYVCAGLLCLAIAYHLGANSANAQGSASGKIRLISSSADVAWVVTDDDDIYSIQRGKTPSVSHGDGWQKYRLGVLR